MSDDIAPVKYPTMSPRPTTYRGVHMRSRLEAAWAEQFDALAWTWTYEPQCFASALGQYLPDFKLSIPHLSDDIFVEVKPAHFMTQEGNGWNGDVDDIDGPAGWNAACGRIRAKIQRFYDIVSANTPVDLFMICTSADDGQVSMWAMDTSQPNAEHMPVRPVRCSYGHVSLAQHPNRSGCPMHYNSAWHVDVNPVESLYAPRGFLTYQPDPTTDPLHERILNGPR